MGTPQNVYEEIENINIPPNQIQSEAFRTSFGPQQENHTIKRTI